MKLGAHRSVTVALFHSMFGLRPVELSAAERLRRAGHRVITPDLFAGAVAADHGSVPALEDGFALMERIGWETIVARAHAAVRDLPASTVLGGFSMGVGVVGSLWPDRLAAAGVFQLHATTPVREGIPAGTPVQAHVADGDRFARPTGSLPSGPARNTPTPRSRCTPIPAPGTSTATRACRTTTPSPPTTHGNTWTSCSRRHVAAYRTEPGPQPSTTPPGAAPKLTDTLGSSITKRCPNPPTNGAGSRRHGQSANRSCTNLASAPGPACVDPWGRPPHQP